jgi:hypothetical protein
MSQCPPNLLLIQADQLKPQVLPAYGGVADTPNLDRLAGEGVVFENAYCNFPLCAPSRFSMLSGRLSSRIGAFDNGAELTAQTPTMAHYLRIARRRNFTILRAAGLNRSFSAPRSRILTSRTTAGSHTGIATGMKTCRCLRLP